MSYTPGPWEVSNHHESVIARGSFDGGWDTKTICHISFERDEQTPANLRLIAAAPELLEVLERALSVIPYVYSTVSQNNWKSEKDGWCEIHAGRVSSSQVQLGNLETVVRAAIKKARGE